jgi:hypothetical protein
MSAIFPKYIAIKRTQGFKVYENTVNGATPGNQANHLKRCHSIYIAYITTYTDHVTGVNKTSLITSDKKSQPVLCTWTHTGIDLNIRVGDKELLDSVPVIEFSEDMKDVLPHASDYVIYKNANYARSYVQHQYYPAAPVVSTEYDIPVAPVVANNVLSIPKHVKALIIADIVSRKESCPVLFEPITTTNAAVTNCGHVFTLSGISTWLSSSQSKSQCPVCKQCCHLV